MFGNLFNFYHSYFEFDNNFTLGQVIDKLDQNGDTIDELLNDYFGEYNFNNYDLVNDITEY